MAKDQKRAHVDCEAGNIAFPSLSSNDETASDMAEALSWKLPSFRSIEALMGDLNGDG